MNLSHDAHDWLGGYPYESISPAEVQSMLQQLGFTHARSFLGHGVEAHIGVFGSGCDEFHYRRT